MKAIVFVSVLITLCLVKLWRNFKEEEEYTRELFNLVWPFVVMCAVCATLAWKCHLIKSKKRALVRHLIDSPIIDKEQLDHLLRSCREFSKDKDVAFFGLTWCLFSIAVFDVSHTSFAMEKLGTDFADLNVVVSFLDTLKYFLTAFNFGCMLLLLRAELMWGECCLVLWRKISKPFWLASILLQVCLVTPVLVFGILAFKNMVLWDLMPCQFELIFGRWSGIFVLVIYFVLLILSYSRLTKVSRALVEEIEWKLNEAVIFHFISMPCEEWTIYCVVENQEMLSENEIL